MTDVIVTDLKRVRPRDEGSVRRKTVRDTDGNAVRILSLDANSATFIDDLALVFERNVAKARRENKLLLGSNDG